MGENLATLAASTLEAVQPLGWIALGAAGASGLLGEPENTRISVRAVNADNNRILWHDGVELPGAETEQIVDNLDWVLRRLPNPRAR